MVSFSFLGDGRAHEKYAAPPGAGESERPVRGHVTHRSYKLSCNPPFCKLTSQNIC